MSLREDYIDLTNGVTGVVEDLEVFKLNAEVEKAIAITDGNKIEEAKCEGLVKAYSIALSKMNQIIVWQRL